MGRVRGGRTRIKGVGGRLCKHRDIRVCTAKVYLTQCAACIYLLVAWFITALPRGDNQVRIRHLDGHFLFPSWFSKKFLSIPPTGGLFISGPFQIGQERNVGSFEQARGKHPKSICSVSGDSRGGVRGVSEGGRLCAGVAALGVGGGGNPVAEGLDAGPGGARGRARG